LNYEYDLNREDIGEGGGEEKSKFKYQNAKLWRPFGQCFNKIPRLGCASLGMTIGDK